MWLCMLLINYVDILFKIKKLCIKTWKYISVIFMKNFMDFAVHMQISFIHMKIY